MRKVFLNDRFQRSEDLGEHLDQMSVHEPAEESNVVSLKGIHTSRLNSAFFFDVASRITDHQVSIDTLLYQKVAPTLTDKKSFIHLFLYFFAFLYSQLVEDAQRTEMFCFHMRQTA